MISLEAESLEENNGVAKIFKLLSTQSIENLLKLINK